MSLISGKLNLVINVLLLDGYTCGTIASCDIWHNYAMTHGK